MRSQSFPLAGQRDFLRLLAPYLPEDITVYHPRTGRYGLLRGLPACYDGQQEPMAEVEFYCDAEAREEGCGDLTEPVSKLLPCLYSFEDLATELLLPDGRRVVPAVEVARLANSGIWQGQPSAYSQIGEATGLVFWLCTDEREVLLEREDFENGTYPMNLAVGSWLRTAHFAVGLTPDQYHRRVVGVDYASGRKPGQSTAAAMGLPELCADCGGQCCASCLGTGKEASRA